jgi:hypothetical protein
MKLFLLLLLLLLLLRNLNSRNKTKTPKQTQEDCTCTPSYGSAELLVLCIPSVELTVCAMGLKFAKSVVVVVGRRCVGIRRCWLYWELLTPGKYQPALSLFLKTEKIAALL